MLKGIFEVDHQHFQNIRLKGDNIQKYLSDWGYVMPGVDKPPTLEEQELKFRTDLKGVPELRAVLRCCNFSVTQLGEPRSYTTSRRVVNSHQEENRKERNTAQKKNHTMRS